MYVERTIAACLAQASEQFRVLMVTGPRQVGKTTCLQHAAGPERGYITLDDPQRDRDVFFRSYGQTYLQRDVRSLANVGDELAGTRTPVRPGGTVEALRPPARIQSSLRD